MNHYSILTFTWTQWIFQSESNGEVQQNQVTLDMFDTIK